MSAPITGMSGETGFEYNDMFHDYYQFNTADGLIRQPYKYLTDLEDSERADRMKRTVDPLWMSKWHGVQTELLSDTKGISFLNNAKASFTSTKFALREIPKNISEKVSSYVDYATEKYKEFDHAQQEWTVETNVKVNKMMGNLNASAEEITERAEDFSVNMNALVTDVQDRFTGLDVSSIAAEEKERARRVNEKVDPLVEGRKHRVEDQLVHSIKLVN